MLKMLRPKLLFAGLLLAAFACGAPQNRRSDEDIRNSLFDNISGCNMRDFLRIVSKTTHPAGTTPNIAVGDYLAQQYNSWGFNVKTHEYSVMLDYPDFDTPNTIHVDLDDGHGSIILSSGLGDMTTAPAEAMAQLNSKWANHWWNGYAKDSKVKGELVYCNYGTLDDLDYVESQNISLVGKIAFVRYGRLWRGAKVREATRRGAIGVILFSDPGDYGPPEGMGPWPETIFMPPGAAQRGSLMNFNGDPLTPFFPALEYAPRLVNESTLREELVLPNVPAMPIGYRDGVKIIATMNGPPAPNNFHGGINATYRLTSDRQYTLNVHAKIEKGMAIKDVCAFMYGSEEPDQMVIIGNHYDAWSNGASDPNSGTAISLEMARALSKTMNETGWRPKRTIVLCNWDSEEYGIVGSVEFVEEMLKVLNARAVAVINIDGPIAGNVTLLGSGNPSTMRVLMNATSHVDNPNPNELAMNRSTVYDSWHYYATQESGGMPLNPPLYGYPGSGSDHYSFMAYAGIPVLNYGYECVPDCSFPLYHTMFELSWTMENLYDRHQKTFEAVAKTTIEVARQLADSELIPLNVSDSAKVISHETEVLADELLSEGFNTTIPICSCILQSLNESTKRLQFVADVFQMEVNRVVAGGKVTDRQKRMLNHRLMHFERAFLTPQTLYPGSYDRHVVFSASQHDSYKGVTFSGVRDPVEYYFQAVQSGDEAAMSKWIEQIQYSLSSMQYAIESAILTLHLDGYHI